MKTISVIIVILSILIWGNLICGNAFAAPEEIMLSTYYPAPYGEYDDLRAKRMVAGQTWSDPAVFTWPAHAATQADLLVESRVGIGTQAPGAMLDAREANSVTAGVHPVTMFQNVAGTAGLSTGWYAGGAAVTGGYINSTGALPLFLGTSGTTQAVTILNTGNVGIGTTSPQQLLHVHNPAAAGATNNAQIQITNMDTLATATDGFTLGLDGATENAILMQREAKDMIFYTGGAAAANERMRILSTGNVGISNTAPTHKLELSDPAAGYATVKATSIYARGGFILHKMTQQQETDAVNNAATSLEEGQMWLNTTIGS